MMTDIVEGLRILLTKVQVEVSKLEGENLRLRARQAPALEEWDALRNEVERLRAENEKLKAASTWDAEESQAIHEENKRLRDALQEVRVMLGQKDPDGALMVATVALEDSSG